MNRRNTGYIKGIDEQVAETPFEKVTSHYGLPAPAPKSSEYRINCVFNESCHQSQYGQLTVNLADPARLIYCHCCGTRGNLLTLLHGLERHTPPVGGRLRGEEFKAAVRTLKEINATAVSELSADQPSDPPPESIAQTAPPSPVNLPMRRHEKEAARALENLWEDLVVDPAEMPPAAAQYFRSRPWLTEDVCRAWRVGYLPRNGRSLFRGYVLYTQHNPRSDVISYSGRDVSFDDKLKKWQRDGQPEKKKPAKHRYVSGYHRGVELYGQQAVRLEQTAVRQSLADVGLIVVEGANDVIRLDCLDAAAVGLCSNRATTEQIAKIIRYSREAAASRVVLLPDCDEEGENGFKELLWHLNEAGLSVRLGWSRAMHEGVFAGRQPEHVSDEEWTGTLLPFLSRDQP